MIYAIIIRYLVYSRHKYFCYLNFKHSVWGEYLQINDGEV